MNLFPSQKKSRNTNNSFFRLIHSSYFHSSNKKMPQKLPPKNSESNEIIKKENKPLLLTPRNKNPFLLKAMKPTLNKMNILEFKNKSLINILQINKNKKENLISSYFYNKNKNNNNNSFNKLKKSDSVKQLYLKNKPLIDNNFINIHKISNNKSPKNNNNDLYKILCKSFIKQKTALSQKIKKNIKSEDISLDSSGNNIVTYYINKIKVKNLKKNEFLKFKPKKYGFASQTGKKELKLKNITENYIIKLNILGKENFNIFGVLDGHGINGHLVSKYISYYIINEIENNKNIQKCNNIKALYNLFKLNNFKLINKVFTNAEKSLLNVSFDCNFSGTTACIIFQIGQNLICANIGDSKAILISNIQNNNINTNISNNNIKNFDSFLSYDETKNKNIIEKLLNDSKKISLKNSKITQKAKIINLSRDLKLIFPKEKERIIKNDGHIEQFKKKDGKKQKPYSVFIGSKKYTHLKMSRSIGDFAASKEGMISDPEIIEFMLNDNVKYLVIGSNNIWEFLSSEDVMNIGYKYYDVINPNIFCNDLIQKTIEKFKVNNMVTGDIIVIVVYY